MSDKGKTDTAHRVFGPRGGPHAHLLRPIERAEDRRGALLRLAALLRGNRLRLLAGAGLVVLSTGCDLAGPFLTGLAVDQGILARDMTRLAQLAVVLLAAGLGSALFTWLRSIVMIDVSQRTVRDLRRDIFAVLHSLPLRFFDRRTHGELMSRFTNDIDAVSNVLAEALAQLFAAALGFIGTGAAMLWINFRLGLLTLVSIPVAAAVTRLVAARTRRGFDDQQRAMGELNGLAEETITGQRVVKSFGRERELVERFEAVNDQLCRASIRAQIFAGFMGPTMNMMRNLTFALVAGAGAWMVIRGWATVGAVVAFLNYSRHFARPLNEMANLYNTIQSALAGAERVFQVMDETPETRDGPGSLTLPRVEGHVEFDRVTFSYEPGLPVLHDVSLEVKPGQKVALIGPTGAGKTTIVNLLGRFYDVDAGSIRLDTHDLRNLARDSFRRELGTVLQDTVLFAGTIRDNIRYGRLDASGDEVREAARVANADQFIHRLPEGYDTVLVETGANLSQGQRQLIAIARAFLADPAVLILDEATSSVDPRTEKHLQEAMSKLMSGRTCFVIAHRLSTIRDADSILVIEHGRIVERGSHAELLARNGSYARLLRKQYGYGDAISPVE